LYAHKKICLPIINKEEKKEQINKEEVIMMLIKENSEFKTMLIEQQTMMMKVIENGTTNNNCNNTTNSHNKAFNLNFFLNETCKDAMNITDFVDSIKLQLSDLEKVGEVGYVEGISNIIIKNLNELDETKRPLHCTDKKRETIYIKDQGQWEKEDDNKSKLKKTINKIAHKNIKLISQFREKYPECKKSESSISDKYNKMIIEAMGGAGDNTLEKQEKIIRNITKATTINK
jgi:antitoxin component HigA of HigAB toxin-antitoxin module